MPPTDGRKMLQTVGCFPLTFYLINSVATVRRFNWTDGKINSSNLVELSGQITEKFDEEFRVLYAQSLPLTLHHGGIHDHLKHLPASSPRKAGGRPAELACLTSTPARMPRTATATLSPGRCKLEATSNYCTAGGSWEVEEEEALLAGSTSHHLLPLQLLREEPRNPSSCHASTQTSSSMTGNDVQPPPPSSSSAPLRQIPPTKGALNDLYDEMSVERQRLFSSIRSKLEHTVAGLSVKREVVDIGDLAEGLRVLGWQRAHEPSPRLHVDCGGGVRGT